MKTNCAKLCFFIYVTILLPIVVSAQNQDDYPVKIIQAMEALYIGDYAKAESLYQYCAEIMPESEDSWLGLQLVRMELKNWQGASIAGEMVLKLNPDNFYAVSRLALTKYMLDDHQNAKKLYLEALEIDPENGLMILGLGFTEIKLGNYEIGIEQCKKAAQFLPGDSRVKECLNIPPPKANLHFWSGIGLTYLHYTNQLDLQDVKSLTIQSGLNAKNGMGLWLGAGMSITGSVTENYDYKQANPVLAAFYKKEKFSIQGSFSWIFANSHTIDNGKIITAVMGYDFKKAGMQMEGALGFYSDVTALQIDPRVRLFDEHRWQLLAGPELIVLLSEEQTELSGRNSQSKRTTADLLWSGHLSFRFVPVAIMAIYIGGYGGHRSFAVENAGLSLSNNSDKFTAGYKAGLGIDLGKHFSLAGEFKHDFGIEQEALKHQFQLLGGTLGLYAKY